MQKRGPLSWPVKKKNKRDSVIHEHETGFVTCNFGVSFHVCHLNKLPEPLYQLGKIDSTHPSIVTQPLNLCLFAYKKKFNLIWIISLTHNTPKHKEHNEFKGLVN